MARIRSAKPDFWTDPLMCSLSRDIRFTFKGIWEVCADDFGRFLGDSRVIKGKIWPTDDDISPKKVDKYLETLATSGRIVLYAIAGVRYGYIVNWLKHQRVSHPTPSIYPDPPPENFANDSGNSREPFTKNSALSGAERKRSGLGLGEGLGSGAEEEFADEFRNPLENLEADPDWVPPSERERQSRADDLDPEIRESDRAAPPAPLVVLPIEAERFVEQLYSLATEKRRLDVRRQLYDSLNPTGRGARLRRGVFVKARSSAHLAACCQAVAEDPPRNVDAAIVIVLEKLQDPAPGPTPSEVHKASEDANRAEEDAYQRAAKVAGVKWARDNPDAYEPIRAEVEQTFSGAGGSSFTRIAKESALTQRCARAAGFPDFETWRSEHAKRTNGAGRYAGAGADQ